MAFKIIRNDITKMTCDAIVNTAGKYPVDLVKVHTADWTAEKLILQQARLLGGLLSKR